VCAQDMMKEKGNLEQLSFFLSFFLLSFVFLDQACILSLKLKENSQQCGRLKDSFIGF
jgi:hypothetical protein